MKDLLIKLLQEEEFKKGICVDIQERFEKIEFIKKRNKIECGINGNALVCSTYLAIQLLLICNDADIPLDTIIETAKYMLSNEYGGITVERKKKKNK